MLMTTVRRLLGRAAVIGAGLLLCLPVAEPARGQSTPSESLRVEWEREPIPRAGWAVEGYVYNDTRYRVGGVRLRAEVLDGDGKVIGEGLGWVYGNVPANGRAYFAVSLPRRGTTYRVTVLTFTQMSLDAP